MSKNATGPQVDQNREDEDGQSSIPEGVSGYASTAAARLEETIKMIIGIKVEERGRLALGIEPREYYAADHRQVVGLMAAAEEYAQSKVAAYQAKKEVTT